MPWYKSGTVSVTNGSNAVVGAGTSFIANCRVGDAFRGPDGGWYEVTNVASNTALSISPNYQGTTNASGAYALAPMQGYVKDSADALRGFVNTYGPVLAAIGPWATAPTPAAARAAMGLGPLAAWTAGDLLIPGSGVRIQSDWSAGAPANRTLFQTSVANGATAVGVVPNGASTFSVLQLFNNSNPSNSTYLQLGMNGDSATIATNGLGSRGSVPLRLLAYGAEQLHLGNGFVGVGTETGNPIGNGIYGTALQRLGQMSLMGADNAHALQIGKKTTTGNFINFYRYVDGVGAGTIGSISRTESTVAYNTTSDYRLKENVRPLLGASEKIRHINWVEYQWIDDLNRDFFPGVLAHQLQVVCPEAVTGEKDAVDETGMIIPQQVDYSKTVPTLGASLQEQIQRIDVLEADNQSLRRLVEGLRARIEALEA